MILIISSKRKLREELLRHAQISLGSQATIEARSVSEATERMSSANAEKLSLVMLDMHGFHPRDQAVVDRISRGGKVLYFDFKYQNEDEDFESSSTLFLPFTCSRVTAKILHMQAAARK